MLISSITTVFHIYWQKYPNKAFLVPLYVVAVIVVVILLDFWYLDKLEGADFKYDTSFFKFQSKNTQKGPFWSKFKNFYFCTKLCILINSKLMISNMAIIFQIYSAKLHKQDIFGSRFENCFFLHKILLNYIFENVTIVLQNSRLQITQKHFCPKFS